MSKQKTMRIGRALGGFIAMVSFLSTPLLFAANVPSREERSNPQKYRKIASGRISNQ